MGSPRCHRARLGGRWRRPSAATRTPTATGGPECAPRWRALRKRSPTPSSDSGGSLEELDAALCALDGTGKRERLGVKPIVGISIRSARGFAHRDGVELYQWLAQLGGAARRPAPHCNVVNGGVHAPIRLDFQEFMIGPIGTTSFSETLRAGAGVYGGPHDTWDRSGLASGLGDEGGFAPALCKRPKTCSISSRPSASPDTNADRTKVPSRWTWQLRSSGRPKGVIT